MKVSDVPDAVRFGGREIDGKFVFELTGGNPALDFVNTLDERGAEPRELLPDYDRLLDWGEQAGLLSATARTKLHRAAKRDPRKATRILADAQQFRDCLFDCFQNLYAGKTVNEATLDALVKWKHRVDARKILAFRGGQLHVGYDEADPAAMLWSVVDEAIDLLSDAGAPDRIKLCEGETCNWVFVDESRQGNRRWCDMSVCGNRAKAKRFRSKQAEGEKPLLK